MLRFLQLTSATLVVLLTLLGLLSLAASPLYAQSVTTTAAAAAAVRQHCQRMSCRLSFQIETRQICASTLT